MTSSRRRNNQRQKRVGGSSRRGRGGHTGHTGRKGHKGSRRHRARNQNRSSGSRMKTLPHQTNRNKGIKTFLVNGGIGTEYVGVPCLNGALTGNLLQLQGDKDQIGCKHVQTRMFERLVATYFQGANGLAGPLIHAIPYDPDLALQFPSSAIRNTMCPMVAAGVDPANPGANNTGVAAELFRLNAGLNVGGVTAEAAAADDATAKPWSWFANRLQELWDLAGALAHLFGERFTHSILLHPELMISDQTVELLLSTLGLEELCDNEYSKQLQVMESIIEQNDDQAQEKVRRLLAFMLGGDQMNASDQRFVHALGTPGFNMTKLMPPGMPPILPVPQELIDLVVVNMARGDAAAANTAETRRLTSLILSSMSGDAEHNKKLAAIAMKLNLFNDSASPAEGMFHVLFNNYMSSDRRDPALAYVMLAMAGGQAAGNAGAPAVQAPVAPVDPAEHNNYQSLLIAQVLFNMLDGLAPEAVINRAIAEIGRFISQEGGNPIEFATTIGNKAKPNKDLDRISQRLAGNSEHKQYTTAIITDLRGGAEAELNADAARAFTRIIRPTPTDAERTASNKAEEMIKKSATFGDQIAASADPFPAQTMDSGMEPLRSASALMREANIGNLDKTQREMDSARIRFGF